MTSIAGEDRHERICMDLVYMRGCAWENVSMVAGVHTRGSTYGF